MLRAWALLISAGMAAFAQPVKDSEAQSKRLVVMIAADFGTGAGIIAGLDEATVYVATAQHVIRQGGKTSAQCAVRFFDAPQSEFQCSPAIPTPAPKLDLAVVKVARNQKGMPPLADLAFDRLAPSTNLESGDAVHVLGNRPPNAWRVNLTADKLAEVSPAEIAFESNFIGPGHSGGALLDRNRRLIGMLVADQPPDGRAIPLDLIAKQLAASGVPVQLRAPGPWLAAAAGRTYRFTISGEVRYWQNQQEFSHPKSDEKSSWVAEGSSHTCVLTRDGLAQCEGNNEQGQLGVGDRGNRNSLAPVTGGHTFATLTTGAAHTCALTPEGKAYCWGAAREGRLGNDSNDDSPVPVAVLGNQTFRTISAGLRHTCGITTSDGLMCWGGVLGTGKPRAGVDPPNAFTPVPVAADQKFRQVAAGRMFTCAITTAGDLYCWKSGEDAEVDRRHKQVIPVPMLAGTKFHTVTSGLGAHACAIALNGEAWCFGFNRFGQLGDGSEKDSAEPVKVTGGHLFQTISAGAHHTCAIRTDGATCCWGGGDGFGPTNQLKPVCLAGK